MAKKTPPKPAGAIAGLPPEQLSILRRLSDEQNANPAGFTYANANETADLVKSGHVLVNAQAVDGFGRIGHMLSDSGKATITANPDTSAGAVASNGDAASAAGSNASKYEIDENVPMPPKRVFGSTGGNVQYPFDALKVGQSFHVGKTDDKPNPAKSLASTVSSANARYAKEIPGETRTNRKGKEVPVTVQERKFEVRAAAADDVRGPGARIFRVA